MLAGLTLLARRFPVLWPLVAGLLFHRLLDYVASVAGVSGALRDRWSRRAPGQPGRAGARAQEGTAYSKTLK